MNESARAKRSASRVSQLLVVGALSLGLGVPVAHGRGEEGPVAIVTKAPTGKRTQKQLLAETIDITLKSSLVKS